jgi:hypothetical protein
MYVETIEVDNELLLKLHSGEVKLRCGQWIKLAWSEHKSRWVGLKTGGTVWAAHYDRYARDVDSQFQCMARIRREDPESFQY